jgi:Head domain of trimeric autotransporter adhesin
MSKPTKLVQVAIGAVAASSGSQPVVADANGRIKALGTRGPMVAGGPVLRGRMLKSTTVVAGTITADQLVEGHISFANNGGIAATVVLPTAAEIYGYLTRELFTADGDPTTQTAATTALTTRSIPVTSFRCTFAVGTGPVPTLDYGAGTGVEYYPNGPANAASGGTTLVMVANAQVTYEFFTIQCSSVVGPRVGFYPVHVVSLGSAVPFPNWSQTLAAGNTSGAYNPTISSGQQIQYMAGLMIGGGTYPASATDAQSVAVGGGAIASFLGAVVVGPLSQSTFEGALALGYNAWATQRYSIALSTTSRATAERAIAIGPSTTASVLGAIVLGANSSATAGSAIAIGYTTTSQAGFGIAIGNGSQVYGTQGIAIGNTALSNASNGTAIGTESDTEASYAIAIGYQAVAGSAGVGTYGVAIGTQSTTNAPEATALGYFARSTNSYTVTIGSNATTSGVNSIAIGYQSSATATDTVVVGRGASATATQGISIGAVVANTAQYGIGIGTQASVGGGGANAYGIGIGYIAIATGLSAIALGAGASSAGSKSVAIGDSATTGGFADSVALGRSATCTAANQIMMGTATETVVFPNQAKFVGGIRIGGANNAAGTTDTYGVSIGSTASASGATSAVAIGSVAIANADVATALGPSTTASGVGAVAVGFGATGSGLRGVAVGREATASGSASTALGYQATTAGYASSTALGTGATNSTANQVMLGTINEVVRVPNDVEVHWHLLGYANDITCTGVSGRAPLAVGGVTVVGNDVGGVVTFTSQGGAGRGTITLTFGKAFGLAPAVVVTGGVNIQADIWIFAISGTAFTVDFGVPGNASSGFTYVVIGRLF